jgi:methyl-accepting chemotaxis protein
MGEKKISGLNSVKTKLIAIMLGVAIIPLAIALIVSYNMSTSKAMEDAENTLLAQASYIQSEFNNVIQQNIKALQTCATNANVVYYLEGNPYGVPDEEMTAAVAAVDAIFNDGNVTALSGPDGMQLFKTSGKLVDVSEREYFQKAILGVTYVSNMNVSKSNGSRICTIAVPIVGHDGKPVGILQRNYDLNVWHEFLKGMADDCFLVDSQGMMVANSQYEITVEDEQDMSQVEFFTSGKEKGYFIADTGKGFEGITAYVKDPTTGWIVGDTVALKEVKSAATKSATIVVIIGIVMIVAAAFISFIMAKNFTEPIKDVNNALAALAEGRFERIEKHTHRKDEFGEIVNDANDVIDKLKNIVTDIKNSASQVNNSSVDLADTADQISKTADDVSRAVEEIASGATQQADEIQNATKSTETISDNIQTVTDNAGNVAVTAQEMSSDSRESAKQLDKLKISSDEMSRAVEEITEKIGSTGAAVERISSKVEAINSIASQTNLLALNASIEAARAGEAGRGFAVVAEEIGKLADESANSANEIRAEMDNLLSESQSAVSVAKEVKTTTDEQKNIIEETVASINKLIEGIESSVAGVESIKHSADACEDSKAEIVDAMSGLSAISEENAASAQETSASMEELNATVNTLSSAAQSLREISDNLIEEMKFFKD